MAYGGVPHDDIDDALSPELDHIPTHATSPVSHVSDSSRTQHKQLSAETKSQEAGQKEVIDAATILEFLAWGRQKQVNYVTALPSCPGELETADASLGATSELAETWPSPGESASRNHPLLHVQILLPDRRKTIELVRYHVDCLLWYHSSFHGPTFLSQLDEFYELRNGQVEESPMSLQWAGLLFAVLTASISCCDKTTMCRWGFRHAEQVTLSRKWLQAAITCLNTADYMAQMSILSCQAIATLTMSAHLLGFSNQQAVLLASATRIAQSLGLHRLDEASEKSVQVETGRRLWSQLCTQDWFSIAFSECYLISPLYSHSSEPLHCNDETLEAVPEYEPTITSYCRFLNSIAGLMPHLQDGIESSHTLFTKYEQVLEYDSRMRRLATQARPKFLGSVPIEPDWPCWTPWARSAAAISSSHKIIMIHRKFLSMSFGNAAFDFSRRTCIAASKTILKESRLAAAKDGPVLWISHAFVVAAAITLCLDLLHTGPQDAASSQHEQLVVEAIQLLQTATNSSIANRGVKLLSDLLKLIQATRASHSSSASRKRVGDVLEGKSNNGKRRQDTDLRALLRELQRPSGSAAISESLLDDRSAEVVTESALRGRSRLPLSQQSEASPPTLATHDEFDYGQFGAGSFAEANDLFSTLNVGLAGISGDAFGSLLDLSKTYSY